MNEVSGQDYPNAHRLQAFLAASNLGICSNSQFCQFFLVLPLPSSLSIEFLRLEVLFVQIKLDVTAVMIFVC